MAKVITEENPKPMKLKFEKVYLPCILQTKKRYVGYMWETRDQTKASYDAKGIETVRRDGIPATAKILEKVIKILFNTKDVSSVKSYVQDQFRKVMSGSVSLMDLTFSKEFRGLGGYRPGASVPALELTRQAMRTDRRAIPRSGERVPYVVVYGEPGLPLIQLVRSPHTVLSQPHLRTNGHYYVTKVLIPPLNRCLLLVGADCFSWFSELPRHLINSAPTMPLRGAKLAGGAQVISEYFVARKCTACEEPSMKPLCEGCSGNPGQGALLLSLQLQSVHSLTEQLGLLCLSCAGHQGGSSCNSLDCPIMYRRVRAIQRRERGQALEELLGDIR